MSVIRLPSASALRTSLFEKVQLGALKAVTDLDIAGCVFPTPFTSLQCSDITLWSLSSRYCLRGVTSAHPADAFLDLPSETDFPDYYTAIPEPVSINLIIDRVKNHKYRTLQAFKDDFELMILNCEHYNKKSAGIVKDAGVLKETFERVLEGLMKENGLELGEAIESKSKSKVG